MAFTYMVSMSQFSAQKRKKSADGSNLVKNTKIKNREVKTT